MAPAGQTLAHSPQPVHFSTSIDAWRWVLILCRLPDLSAIGNAVGPAIGDRVTHGSSISRSLPASDCRSVILAGIILPSRAKTEETNPTLPATRVPRTPTLRRLPPSPPRDPAPRPPPFPPLQPLLMTKTLSHSICPFRPRISRNILLIMRSGSA
jgi:hypothetical protein